MTDNFSLSDVAPLTLPAERQYVVRGRVTIGQRVYGCTEMVSAWQWENAGESFQEYVKGQVRLKLAKGIVQELGEVTVSRFPEEETA